MHPRMRRVAQRLAFGAQGVARDLLTIRSGDPAASAFLRFGERSVIYGPQLELANPGAVELGDDCVVRAMACLEALAAPGTPVISIGDRVHIGYGVRLVALNGIRLGCGVAVGHGTTLADTIHDWKRADGPAGHAPLRIGRPMVLEDGAWIGNNCVVTGGITIGQGAVVGPNSVVTRSVPEHTVVVGNPAGLQRRRRGDGEWEWVVDPATMDLEANER